MDQQTVQNGAADQMAHMSICIECSCVVDELKSTQSIQNRVDKRLGTSRWLLHCDGFNMTVFGADVRPVNCVRDLGVPIDSNMRLSNHVNNVAGICFYQLR